MTKDLIMARTVAARVAEAGGRAYFVGGYVRDSLLERPCKDIDIEVHGITPETLSGILDSLGERVAMGASFGVFGLRHYGLDIAMPRAAGAKGGYQEMEASVDPFIGTYAAARRRDFTVNAMMRDVLTGELTDCFGGEADLARGVIRHTSDSTFTEDPLRVLRAARFAACMGFTVAAETVALARGVPLAGLARERVYGETEKALVKAERPSVFLRYLKDMDAMDVWFPELNDDTRYDVAATLDSAAPLREASECPVPFVFSALCGGMSVTEAETFLTRLTDETRLRRYVGGMLTLRGRANDCAKRNAPAGETLRLLDSSVCPSDLILLARAEGHATEYDTYLAEHLRLYRERAAMPCVTGGDLIAAGYRPGPLFSDALSYARGLLLDGIAKDEALAKTRAYLDGQVTRAD